MLVAHFSNHIFDLLRITNMSNCKGTFCLMSTSYRFMKGRGKDLKDGNQDFFYKTVYRSAIGALIYATFIRLDIAFTVSKLSQFVEASKEAH